MRLVIAGGGTGGHLFPGIAVAEALIDLSPASEVLFVGTAKGIEATAVPKAGFQLAYIAISGLKRMGLKKQVSTLAQLPKSVFDARAILKRFGADAVLGVGGYASGPVIVAARTLGLPTAICEQNSVPGLTNKLLGRFVKRVFVTFDAARSFFPSARVTLSGNPVRRSFVLAAALPTPAHEPGVVFTFGGSQGARPLNETVPLALALVRAAGITVTAVHQAGVNDVDSVKAAYAQASIPAVVASFIDNMVDTYRRAAIVICRAGATSCAELTALGVPAILVPFPQAADDHQTKNAEDLARTGACVVLSQAQMTPRHLADAIIDALKPQRREQLVAAARAAGHLDAAAFVARSALTGFHIAGDA